MRRRVHLHEVYFEIKRYGNYLRVACIDAESGLETYSTGPVKLGVENLKRSAHRKLEYIVSKHLEKASQNRNGWDA